MFFLKTKDVDLIIHPPQKYTVQIKHYNPLSNTERIKPSDIQKFYATKKSQAQSPSFGFLFRFSFLVVHFTLNE